MSSFELSAESLATLEREGAFCFGADEKVDVRDVSRAFVEKALQTVKDAHSSVLCLASTFAEVGVSARDAALSLPDNAHGARVMRDAINDLATLAEDIFSELLGAVGNFVHEDVLNSIGRKAP
jgi:hypothetical protein